MSRTFILDGNSLLFRCFFATFHPGTPLMTNHAGVPTNAIFGFVKMISSLKHDLGNGDRMVVCFDTGHPTFRSKEIANYKAQRKPIDPALKLQMPIAHAFLDAYGIDHAEMEGYEGDDVAGSLAKYSEKQGDHVILFTSDKDFLQLVDDNTEVHSLRKGLTDVIVYTKDNVKELFGCRADQVVDFKAIAGDPSDNYKGIPHVGEKTAFKLLDKYDHLEDILTAFKGDDKTALGRNLNAGAEQGRLCLKIATIKTDLDVKAIYDRSEPEVVNKEKLKAFFDEYDLHKFAFALGLPAGEPKAFQQQAMEEAPEADVAHGKESQVEYKREADFSYAFVKDLDFGESPVGVSAIIDGSNENASPILGLAIVYGNGKQEVIEKNDIAGGGRLREWLAGDAPKSSLDSKTLYVVCNRLGLSVSGIVFDFILASYLIDSDHAADLDDAFKRMDIHLPVNAIDRITTANALMMANEELLLKAISSQDSMILLTEVELPLAKNLAKMEIEGMPIDLGTLSTIGESYRKILEQLQEQIYQYAGEEFNIKSPMQVSHILFEKLGLQKGPKENGSSIEVLTNHYEDHPIVPLIIAHRTYSKIISGYIEALPKHVFPDGKIHAVINQTMTSTGRLSMSEPNLQNVSIRKEEGKEIRKAFFYPDSDYEFLSLDYSQIELRVLASLGNIKNLIEVCNSGEDIHKATASKVFGVPIDQVTPEMRRKAKTVNFGIVYGISAYGLKQRLGISFAEARQTIDLFKSNFEGIDQYEDSQIAFARTNGYVKTILNRRRYFPDINSPIRMKRSFSERAAVNATIQGSAADLIKVAMNKVSKLLEGKKTKMILQIHDELVFKICKEEEKELIPAIAKTMDSALPLKVKLTVDGHTGHSWYDCK